MPSDAVRCRTIPYDAVRCLPIPYDSVRFRTIPSGRYVEPSELSQDLDGHEDQPIAATSFVLFWVVLGRLVLLNMVVALVLHEYSKLAEDEKGLSAFMTEEQAEWVRLQEEVVRIRAKEMFRAPKAPWRRCLFYFVQDPKFEYAVLFVIVLNMFAMGAFVYDPTWSALGDWSPIAA